MNMTRFDASILVMLANDFVDQRYKKCESFSTPRWRNSYKIWLLGWFLQQQRQGSKLNFCRFVKALFCHIFSQLWIDFISGL